MIQTANRMWYLFKTLQQYGAILGLFPPRPGQTSFFNRRTTIVLMIFGLFLISSTAFLMLDAQTFGDYAEAFFQWMTLLFIGIGYVINVQKTGDMFRIIKHCEETIENGK